jgi:hypothetical protein
MKKIIIISLLSMFLVSCTLPYTTTNYNPLRYTHYPHIYHQPTKVIVVKDKKHNHKKKHKRHIKVRINKHKKTK